MALLPFALLALAAAVLVYQTERAAAATTPQQEDHPVTPPKPPTRRTGSNNTSDGTNSGTSSGAVTTDGRPRLDGEALGPPPGHPRIERRTFEGVDWEIHWGERTKGGSRMPPGFKGGKGHLDKSDHKAATYAAGVGSPFTSRVPIWRADKGWRTLRFEYHNAQQEAAGPDTNGNIHITSIFVPRST